MKAFKVEVDKLPELRDLIQKITSKQILVGIPAENAQRDDGSEFDNAAIGYVQETGCPERNIPARPHLVPAVRETAPRTISILKNAALKALTVEGTPEMIDKALVSVGMIVVSKAQQIIRSKIPPPLADSTLQKRAARANKSKKGIKIAKGAKAELAMRAEMRAQFGADYMPMSVNVTPLIDSGEYIHKITYVIRNRTK